MMDGSMKVFVQRARKFLFANGDVHLGHFTISTSFEIAPIAIHSQAIQITCSKIVAIFIILLEKNRRIQFQLPTRERVGFMDSELCQLKIYPEALFKLENQ
jgi:hypothetical protein